MSLPRTASRGSLASELCCFCGRSVDHAESEPIRVSARWDEDGAEREQSWGAHRACLLERMHEQVKGQGPIFGV